MDFSSGPRDGVIELGNFLLQDIIWCLKLTRVQVRAGKFKFNYECY